MFCCLICKEEFETEKALHQHIGRSEKTKLEYYYPKFYPRFSIKTGEAIKFKNADQYKTSLFNSRIEMVSWLKQNGGRAEEVIKELIKLRATIKNLTIAPDTVYGRTCVFPPPTLVEYLGIDYNNICAELGLKTSRDYKSKLAFADDSDLNIIIDKREQKPLSFNAKYKIISNSLSFGDYSTSSGHFKNIFFERKSIPDLCGSLSKGFDRLCREFDRAAEFGASIVIICEEDINAISSVGYTPHTKRIKATPEFLFSRIRDILVKYPHVQFAFCPSRTDAARILIRLMVMQNDITTIDIQSKIDLKLI